MGKLKTTILFLTLLILIFSCSSDDELAMSSEDLSKTLQQQASIQVFGEIKAQNEYLVSLSFPVQVEKIYIENGELAKKGERILKFDSSQFMIDLSSKEYELAVSKIEYEKLKKDFEKSGKSINNEYLNLQNNIDSNKEELEQLQKELQQNQNFFKEKNSPELLKLINEQSTTINANKQLEDMTKEKEKLFEKQIISQQEYDEAQQNLEKQKASLKTIEISIDSALFQLESLIKQQEIKVKNLQAVLENQERQLANLQGPETSALDIQHLKIQLLEKQLTQLKNQIKAPYINSNYLIAQYENSIISNHQTREGNATTTSQHFYNEIDADSLIIVSNIPEDFIPDLFIGIDVEITPLANRNLSFKGKVNKISEMAQIIQGESVIPIEIGFENTDNFLKLGYNVDVKIFLRTDESDSKNDEFNLEVQQ